MVVAAAIAVLATHDLPVVGHGGGSHDGLGVDELAAVCLAVTATAASAAAVLMRPVPWTRARRRARWASVPTVPRRTQAGAARAGPALSAVLRL